MADYPKELKNVVRDGMCTQGMVSLIGGPFLSAFLVALGANYFWIGLAAAIPPLAQLMQIPAIYLVERYRKRRLICVVAAFISRLFWLFPIISVFFAPAHVVLVLTLAAIFGQSAVGAISGTSWNSWMHDLVPIDILGRFFGYRMKISTVVGLAASVVAAIFIDQYMNFADISMTEAYSFVFALGIALGFLGVFFLLRTPEPVMNEPQPESLVRKLLRPIRDPIFRPTIIFLGLWNFAINMAIPFFVVYLLKRLHFNMGAIIGLAVISQLANIFSFRMWGRFADRFSNKTVLAVAGPMFLVVILMWPFTTLPGKYVLTVPLLILIHILGGFSIAGTTLAVGNIALKQAPHGMATPYLAVNSIVSSIALFFAPLIGGAIAQFFAVRELSVNIKWASPGTVIRFQTLNFQELDFLFFIAAIVGFIVMQTLGHVKERGEIEDKFLIRELRGQMQRNIINISSVVGLRYLVAFPYYMIRLPVVAIKKVKESISGITFETDDDDID